jgi:D-alanine-D-alanine ligase
MKGLFAAAGLPQVPWRLASDREEAERAAAELSWPVFVKPANLGSSVGVSRVTGPGGLAAAVDLAFAYDTKILLEQGLAVREVEVSVLGNARPEASVPGEIVPDRDFYDYASKYSAESRTELRIPAPLPADTAAELRDLAVRAYRAVDASGFARVDFFVEKESSRVLVNEINTIPGFTSISMFPKLWEASGVGYADLVDRLVQLGMERHRRRASLRTVH